MKKLIFCLAVLGAVLAGCSANDDNENSGNDTGIKGDYIATTNVRTVTLKEDHFMKGVTIYKDFNYKYDLALYSGQMCLLPYARVEGAWELLYNYPYDNSYPNINIIDLGKIDCLSDVSAKVEVTWASFPAAQPGHGYAACFITEEETKYLRLYISSYKLDSNDTLESITVQYQLY